MTIFVISALTCGYLVQSHNSEKQLDNSASSIHTHKEHDAKTINENVFANSSPALPNTILPHSLADIDHKVKLQADEDGNLLVNSDTRDLFEFYLSAMGEEPLRNILIRIRYEIENQLPSPAKEQAFLLLKNFVDYKVELSLLSTDLKNLTTGQSSLLDSLKLQKSKVARLRAQYFSPGTYQAFFQQEASYDDFMLAQLTIQKNSQLNDKQKNQQLQALLNELPQEVKQIRQTVSRHGDLFQSTEDMRDQGASKEDIYQLRATTLGNQAATALAELDVKRNQWQQRLSRYAEQRDAILDSGLNHGDSRLAIEALIKQDFSHTESIRVKALEHSL